MKKEPILLFLRIFISSHERLQRIQLSQQITDKFINLCTTRMTISRANNRCLSRNIVDVIETSSKTVGIAWYRIQDKMPLDKMPRTKCHRTKRTKCHCPTVEFVFIFFKCCFCLLPYRLTCRNRL